MADLQRQQQEERVRHESQIGLMQQEIAKMCEIMTQQAMLRKRGKAGGKRNRIRELERQVSELKGQIRT